MIPGERLGRCWDISFIEKDGEIYFEKFFSSLELQCHDMR